MYPPPEAVLLSEAATQKRKELLKAGAGPIYTYVRDSTPALGEAGNVNGVPNGSKGVNCNTLIYYHKVQ